MSELIYNSPCLFIRLAAKPAHRTVKVMASLGWLDSLDRSPLGWIHGCVLCQATPWRCLLCPRSVGRAVAVAVCVGTPATDDDDRTAALKSTIWTNPYLRGFCSQTHGWQMKRISADLYSCTSIDREGFVNRTWSQIWRPIQSFIGKQSGKWRQQHGAVFTTT